MITSAIKKQTSVCCSISLNPYISNLESRIKKVLLMSAALPIAHFICQTLSLNNNIRVNSFCLENVYNIYSLKAKALRLPKKELWIDNNQLGIPK